MYRICFVHSYPTLPPPPFHYAALPSLELRDLYALLCLLNAEFKGMDHLAWFHTCLKVFHPEPHMVVHTYLAFRRLRQED